MTPKPKRPKAPKRNKTQPSSGSASKAKTKGGGLFGFSKRKTRNNKGVTQVGSGPRKKPSVRSKRKPTPFPGSPADMQPDTGRPVGPPTREKRKPTPFPGNSRPVRGGGKPKPPTREKRKPTPFPGSSADMKPDTGRGTDKPVGRPKGGPVKKRPLPKPIKETKTGPVKKRRKLAQPRPINPTGKVSFRGPRLISRKRK